MRLEPEAVRVLGDLDAQIGAVEVRAEVLLDVSMTARLWNASLKAFATG